MKKGRPTAAAQRTKWNEQSKANRAELRAAIKVYADATVAASWAGGGDPADAPVLAAEEELASAKLDRLIDKLFPIEED